MWNLCAKFSVSLDSDGEFDWISLSNFLDWFTNFFFFRFYECVWHIRNSTAKCEVVGHNGLRNCKCSKEWRGGRNEEWTWYWPCNWKCKYSRLQRARTIFIYRKQAFSRETFSRGTWLFLSQFCLKKFGCVWAMCHLASQHEYVMC
jgi:hypothetical protein